MKACLFWFLGIISFGFFLSAHAADNYPQEIQLLFDDQTLKLNFKAQEDLIDYGVKQFLTIGDTRIPLDPEYGIIESKFMDSMIESDFFPQISEEKLKLFFEESNLFLEKERGTVEIRFDANENIMFEGKPQQGFRVDYSKLVRLINESLVNGETNIRVPADKIFSRVISHPDLKQRGIREIIAVGESNFAGSSKARRQNILAAARKFNGVIIRKNRMFSFNEILEDVNEEDGFVKELVIKGDKTEKELGGGVCQVSTTAFRAAFQGGLPIRDRRNHSYAVPYYKPFGLDAAIYIGALDMRFINDTPGDILIQTIVDKNDLYFVYYGTHDHRRVITEGPIISKYRKAPDTIVLESEDLPAGEMKVVNDAHDGFEAEWVRKVVWPDGDQNDESFVSNYRPWPARVLKGSETEVIPESNKDEVSISNNRRGSILRH